MDIDEAFDQALRNAAEAYATKVCEPPLPVKSEISGESHGGFVRVGVCVRVCVFRCTHKTFRGVNSETPPR